MKPSSEDQKPQLLPQSKPLQTLGAIEQSLMILKQKITQMNKRQCQNTLQIEKIFYSSIPNLKNKLYQTIECQKAQQKKKILFCDNVLRQKQKINLQRKMINQKEIQRNKELMNMMKINEHNKVKERSRKNQIFIQKMKNLRIQQNKKKKDQVRNSLQHSRHRIQDFHTIKMDSIRREKQQDGFMMKKKMTTMETELEYLGARENETYERLDKSEEALKQLRFAVEKMQKMNENEFIKLKNKIYTQFPSIAEEKLIEKMLLSIVQTSKQTKAKFNTRKIYHSKWSSQHMTNAYRG